MRWIHELKKIFQEPLPRYARITAVMFAVVTVQLVWWILFFEQNQKETKRVFERLDQQIEAMANQESIQLPPDLLVLKDGKYRINDSVKAARNYEHKRKLVMLISETVFVIAVLIYGVFYIFYGVRKEKKFVSERNIFLNSVTHELKTPLAGILLGLQTLEKRKLTPAQKKEIFDESKAEVRRLEEQINSILLGGELFRGEENGVSHQYIHPGKVLESWLQENETFIKRSGVQLRYSIPDEALISIRSDLFKKVIGNLIDNSAKYAGSSSDIHIHGKIDHGEIILIYQDHGPGIPDSELETIFKPFYRIPNSEGPVRGSGMGLYITEKIIKNAKGKIRALSSQKGACFEMRFPLVKR